MGYTNNSNSNNNNDKVYFIKASLQACNAFVSPFIYLTYDLSGC